MGCDIHGYIEVKDDDGKWKRIQVPNEYYDPKSEFIWEKELMSYDPFPYRNYNFFAVIGNVRNGHGFAGCKTGDGFEPIDYDRGLPRNASDEVVREADEWAGDGHSHSWLYWKELTNYNWDQTTKIGGYIKLPMYLDHILCGKPITQWCGDTHGPHTVKYKADYFEYKDIKQEDEIYIQYFWPVSYRDAVGKYVFDRMLLLEQYFNLNEIDLDNVRFVFWFDN